MIMTDWKDSNLINSTKPRNYPLIILDYNLPQLNAEEILKILNAHQRYDSIPKIVWSTSNSAIYKSKCINLGAGEYLVKPRDMVSLVETAKYMFSFCNLSLSCQ